MDEIKRQAQGLQVAASEEGAAVQQYVEELTPEVESVIDAGVTAIATGQDPQPWYDAAEAQIEAVALRTLRSASSVSFDFEERVRLVSVTAIRMAIAIA
jgi:hypothetical protein